MFDLATNLFTMPKMLNNDIRIMFGKLIAYDIFHASINKISVQLDKKKDALSAQKCPILFNVVLICHVLINKSHGGDKVSKQSKSLQWCLQ